MGCLHHRIIRGPTAIGGNIPFVRGVTVVVGAGGVSGWVRGCQKDSSICSCDPSLKVEPSSIIASVGIVKSREARGLAAAIIWYTHGEFVAPVCQVYPADYRDTIIVGDVIRGEPNRDVEGSQGCVIESVIGAGFSTDQVSAIRIGVNSDGNLIRCGRTPHGVVEVGVAIVGIVERIRRKTGQHREEMLRGTVLDRDATT